jgi:arylsulfatase A-like enzyme
VVNSAWLAKEQYGVTRDFQQYLFVDDAQDRRAPNSWVTDQAMAWIRDRDTRPLFLFVHYYDVHSDYSSLPQYERLFVQPYSGIADGTGWQLARASFEDDFVEMCHRNYDPAKCRIGTEEKYLAVDRSVGKIFFDDDDLRHIEELYDAGIRQLDNELGRLFALMASEGAFDPALILITSDHGEEFMDHGRMDHFLTMHQEIIRVPLIVRGPGVPAGLRIETPVSLVDLSPTILAFADVSKPPTTDGLDLTPLLRGETPTAFDDRYLFGEASGGLTYAMMMEGIYPIYRSIRRGKHKLIHNSKENSWTLYDLELDPGETQDIAADRPDITAELSAEIRARYAGFDPNPAPTFVFVLDGYELERLRALGYVP